MNTHCFVFFQYDIERNDCFFQKKSTVKHNNVKTAASEKKPRHSLFFLVSHNHSAKVLFEGEQISTKKHNLMPAPRCIYCHVVIFSEGGVGGKSSLKSECTLKHKRDNTTFDEYQTGSLESCNARMSKHGKSGSEFCQISPFCWKKNPSAVVPSGVSLCFFFLSVKGSVVCSSDKSF